jgi:hypothetical protein
MAYWGTDIGSAYGGTEEPAMESSQQSQPPQQQQHSTMLNAVSAAALANAESSMQQQEVPPRVQQPPTNRGTTPNSYPFYVQAQPPSQAVVQTFVQPSAPAPATYAVQMAPPAAPGYMDKFWGKRREIVKLASLALVVVLALGLHQWISFVVDRYVSNARLSLQQETILRLSYPVFVLFFLWHLKAQSSRSWTE